MVMEDRYKEVEIKLRFASPAEAKACLEAHGATVLSERAFEENVLFDRAVNPLKQDKKMLRLRKYRGKAWLTLKAPVPGKHRHKVRREYETEIDQPEAMVYMLGELGFVPSFRYQKYRTLYEIDGLEACLDETPVGTYVELEGLPERIDAAAAQCGFCDANYIRESYRDLHELAAAAQGTQAGDMQFPDGTYGDGR
jgi:adenylate cyclase class 2